MKGFLTAKICHGIVTAKKTEEINAFRKRWIRKCLRGIVTVLQQDSIRLYSNQVDFDEDYAYFSDADIEDIQSVCRRISWKSSWMTFLHFDKKPR